MSFFQSVLGLLFFLSIPFILSANKKNVSWRFVGIGVLSQFILAFVFLKVPPITEILVQLNKIVSVLQSSTDKASQFMLGYIAGGPTPFLVSNPENNFIVAFRILPLILVISALSALLFHFGILTRVVSGFAFLLQRFFKISGALGFGSAASVFLGTIETPLIIRPYLAKLSRAELLALITCSMSTVAGTVIFLYASVLEKSLPNALTHLLVASIISVPAALTVSHLFLPTSDSTDSHFELEKSQSTWAEVLLNSIHEALQMIFSIVAIIIVLFAFIHIIDSSLGIIDPSISVASILSQLLRPVTWLLGYSWDKSAVVAELFGTKIVLNEFVSYLKLAELEILTQSEKLVAAYALCGFANFASAGIIIAGLTSMLPDRRSDVISLTLWALLFGNISTLITGCIINILSVI